MKDRVTFIVIGRNEGRNLARCFTSIKKISDNIIYVDSDSDDDSILIAKSFNIKRIIKLKSNYYSASLGRYVGAQEAKTEFIQFIDGDMTLSKCWIPFAIKRLSSTDDVAVVLGYKKVYKKNDRDYSILSDNKEWEPDYLGGAFLIRTNVYKKANGFDVRMIGEEERDLYVRIRSLGLRVLSLQHLMVSHYDFKNTNLKLLLFSERTASVWLPLINAFINRNFKSYIFVYRQLLPSLLLDILTIIFICTFSLKYLFFAILLQIIELIYVLSIRRRGYFIFWKAGFISILKAIKLYRRKIDYSVEIIDLSSLIS